ncbi:hypothetical protein D3C87_1324110 [compost metagenome]
MSLLEIVNYSCPASDLFSLVVEDVTTVMDKVHYVWVRGDGIIIDTTRVTHLVAYTTCYTANLRG